MKEREVIDPMRLEVDLKKELDSLYEDALGGVVLLLFSSCLVEARSFMYLNGKRDFSFFVSLMGDLIVKEPRLRSVCTNLERELLYSIYNLLWIQAEFWFQVVSVQTGAELSGNSLPGDSFRDFDRGV